MVLADGKELWHSEVLKPADSANVVDVDISGVEKLLLRTTGERLGGGRRGGARIVWGDPVISKAASKSE